MRDERSEPTLMNPTESREPTDTTHSSVGGAPYSGAGSFDQHAAQRNGSAHASASADPRASATAGGATPNGARAADAGPAHAGFVATLLALIQSVSGSASDLMEVHADRMKLSVRRTFVRWAVATSASVCAVLWLGSATLAVVRGMCGGIAAWFGGRAWLGDLVGGLVALALVASGIALFVRQSERRELARLRKKYDNLRRQHVEHEHAA